MKYGKSLQELAAEIQRQQENKRDFIIPANKINAFVNENHVELGFGIAENDSELFTAPLTDNGHVQLGQFCNIPKKYYDMMLAHPALLATNLKHWLERSEDRKMIRSMDGNVRAVLSDRYRRLDNFDLAQNVLPMLFEANAKIESSEITDKRLYIKAIMPNIQTDIKVGDPVQAGLIISNSETGHGSLSVKPLIFRLVCSNGLIAEDYSTRKYHVGAKNEDIAQIEFSNEALTAEDKAFWLKVRDTVKYTLSEVTFEKIVESMREATHKRIAEPDKAIELAAKKFDLSEGEQKSILMHLIEGGDLTNYGFMNSVTRSAQDVDSYDRSTELESIGYQIMNQNWN